MHTQIRTPFRSLSRISFILFFALVCSGAGSVHAQDAAEDTGPKPEKIFESNETLTISITAPWKDIIRKKKVTDPYPATMQFTDSLGQTHTLPLTVERRGITRQAVCKHPPIRLRMNKEDMKGTPFRGQNNLKLVTHCDKGEKWEQYYVKEYLAYRFFNEITEKSFRARPLAITYIEAGDNKADEPLYGFLIEDISDVGKRNDLSKLSIPQVKRNQLDNVQASQLALFQYMIANVDFEILSGPQKDKCCHNARLIGDDSGNNVVALPYDFDSSGFVNAHYAVPNDFLGIRAVTQRLYRGFCSHNGTMEAARQQYIAEEADIMGLISSEPRLTERTAKTANTFIGNFFETIKSDADFQKQIIGKCRK